MLKIPAKPRGSQQARRLESTTVSVNTIKGTDKTEITHALSAAADEKLRETGLSRTYCCDLFDDDARAHRRMMRYRALCDNSSILTQ